MSNTCKDKEHGKRLPPEKDFQNTQQLHFFVEPFTNLVTHHFNNVCPEHKSLGLILSTDQVSNRAYISGLESAHTMNMSKTKKANIKGAYIIRIDDAPIFTKTEAESALKTLQTNQVSKFSIVLAPEQQIDHRKIQSLLKDYNFFAKKHFDKATVLDEYQQNENTDNIEFNADINHLQSHYSPSPIDLSEHDVTLTT